MPEAGQSAAGELRAPGQVIYWRVGPAAEPGKIHLVLARQCPRESRFDNWISVSTLFPGDLKNREDAGSAVKEVNKLVRCLPK